MDYIKQLSWRYATKVFDKTQTISNSTLKKIEDSLVLTPSSFGLQPWKFVVITSEEIRQNLLPLSWGQTQVTDCSHFVVLCAKSKVTEEDVDLFLNDMISTRGGTKEDLSEYENLMKGFLQRMDDAATFHWAKNQVYIALGQLMATAAALEVDACPMEGIDPSGFDQIIQMDGYHTVVACALGYRSKDDKYAELEKVRYDKDVLIEYKK